MADGAPRRFRVGDAVGLDQAQQRRLEPREAEVVALPEPGAGQIEGAGPPRGGSALDRRAARVAESEQAGALVERLPGRVVERPPEVPVCAVPGHQDQLRVAAGDEQADEREVRRRRRFGSSGSVSQLA